MIAKECNAECVKIDRSGQYFKTDHSEPHCQLIILSGYNRTRVEVGDKGRMNYRVTKSTGLWYFTPDTV